jgi:glutamine---fructose-6-phosphate transaminase (isomerizing)
MCGIVGYIGSKQAQPILLECLEKLEYRGYDSCGVAVAFDGIEVIKDAMRVKALREVAHVSLGTTGIGHTRWATHGPPSRINAHPHLDCEGNIAVVHNGVITNCEELRARLIKEGHVFLSETDTEVIPHLIEKYYRGNLEEATQKALNDIEGSYAIAVLAKDVDELVVARKDSPLILGLGDRENFIASDVPAILDHTDRVIYLEDGDLGIITKNNVEIKRDGVKVKREEQKVLWNVEEAQKAGYEHFMLKEIHEQPKVIRNTLGEYAADSSQTVNLSGTGDTVADSILLLACGTSYHAAMIGKYVMRELMQVPARIEIASEYNYYSDVIDRTTGIAVTQSGETADTLKAMKRLKEAGCRVVAITNVVGSTASRISNQTMYTRAGPEISVAATKSFIAQLMALYWIAIKNSKTDSRRLSGLLTELRQLPNKVQQLLDDETQIAECAKTISGYENVFFIGRGINYPVALEGALKLKEISYIHAEGYASGELKHGPFALLGVKSPVVAIVARDSTHEAMLTNIKEVKARKSPVIAIAEEGDDAIEELVDMVITVPAVHNILSPVVNTVALQLLAYYTAKDRGCPIDYPRNLAKSVTVE